MNKFKSLIFPSGKCHQKYTQYVGWSFCSTVLVSAESVLSTHSMLTAIDTGSESIRTANYIGKDIIGQIGSLWYMSKMGEKADKSPKKFLMYSNIIQQISYGATCVTPLVPSYFLPIAGVSNILANISYTGFGAINAKCIQQLAIDDNIGEIYAKICVINTIGSSIGLVCGLCITSCVLDHSTRLLFLPALGILRVYTYNKAIEGLIE
jgi:hypothetical protein